MKQDKYSKFDVLHALTNPNFAQNPGPLFATAHSASPNGVFQNPHDEVACTWFDGVDCCGCD